MSKRLSGLMAAALAAFISTPALAILPDSGMWSIGEELNGKPGRGIQIDRQGGSTLILTYFGYRADGSSLFLQAAGTLKDGKQFDGVLTEYRNGRALGGQARDGELAQEAGPVRIVFDSSTTATITLPGEAPQRLQRFQFEDLRNRLNFTFSHSSAQGYARLSSPGEITFKVDENTLIAVEKSSTGNTACEYQGNLKPSGNAFRSEGTAQCFWGATPRTYLYNMEDLKVDEFGALSARFYFRDSISPELAPFLRSVVGICKGSIANVDVFRCQPSDLKLDPGLWKE
ncbi:MULTISPECIES: hypothetical protein [Delftia]|uniref:hypothetical protein n=1 Tax=Delftia TaxID=80865 RepID=UPI000926AA46|nr:MULTISPECIES: hypothetical protein [Delftia]MDH0419966.1 hypothetical protein [Delftia tsuruhatensis]OJX19450.1 MAG: hypothetical protein BGO79_11125 [Delftia sp. 67-8]